MPIVSFYAELKGWQTAIGATFGFVALISGALFNFHLNRRRDKDLHCAEVLAVATALYGEIILLREEIAVVGRAVAYRRRSGKDDTIDDQFVTDYRPRDSILYPALANKLGILPPELVLAITRFHGAYQKAQTSLSLMVDKNRGFTFSTLAVLRPTLDAIMAIKPALRRIESMASIATACADPDLGSIEDIVEMEEVSFAEP